MDRHRFTNEDREALIADLAGKNLATRRALVLAKDPTALREVSNSVLDYLAHAADLGDLVLGSVAPSTARFVVGKTFRDVVHAVMAGEAEADAIAEVERMERNRAESAEENRIDLAECDRLMR
jgi:hypothetical protein